MSDPIDDPVQAATHVLHYYFPGEGWPGGSFSSSLVRSFATADQTNRRRLGQAFPAYANAFEILDGRDHLATAANLEAALAAGVEQLRQLAARPR